MTALPDFARFLADAAKVSVLITDARGAIVWANAGFQRVTGYPLDSIRGRKPGDLLQGPGTDPDCVRFMGERLRMGLGFEREVLNYDSAGRPYWVSLEVTPIRDDDGAITHFIGVQHDITRHKQAETEIERRERLQRALVEITKTALEETDQAAVAGLAEATCTRALRDATVRVYDLRDGIVTTINPPAAGESPEQATPHWLGTVALGREYQAEHPKSADGPTLVCPINGERRPIGAIAITLHRDTPLTDEEFGFVRSVANTLAQSIHRASMTAELTAIRRDLEDLVRERTHDLITTNHRLEQEVEQREKVSEELRASQTFLQSALDSLSAHIAILDDDGVIIAVNRAWQEFASENTDGHPLETVGINYLKICEQAAGSSDAPEASLMGRGISEVLNGKRRNFYLQYPCHAPHDERWFQARVSRFKVGGRDRVIISHENITEAKVAERRLRQHLEQLSHVQRLETMGEMSAALAHELNQPLAAISNYTSGCIRRMKVNESVSAEVLDAMQQALSEANRAAEIIRRMRRFSRNAELQREPAQINSIVDEAVQLITGDSQRRSIRLVTHFAHSLPPILADAIHLQQVLINLIRNASDAMDDAPESQRIIEIETTSPASDRVEVRVTDHGPGITSEAMDHLFDPFMTTKETGMGLGLAICRSIIEAHGGRIWAETNQDSSGATIGSTFGFLLPAAIMHGVASNGTEKTDRSRDAVGVVKARRFRPGG